MCSLPITIPITCDSVDPKQLDALFESDKEAAPTATTTAAGHRRRRELRCPRWGGHGRRGNLISIDEFPALDLRVAKVLSAASWPARTSFEMRVDWGTLAAEIFAGIRAAYDHAAVVGAVSSSPRELEPRKMRFGTSEDDVAAGPGGKTIRVGRPTRARHPACASNSNDTERRLTSRRVLTSCCPNAMHALRLSRMQAYAAAIAEGTAEINQCLQRRPRPLRRWRAPRKARAGITGPRRRSPPHIAWIDESRCMAAHALAPCPVDAIVGAAKSCTLF